MKILIHAADGSPATGIGQHVYQLGKGLVEEGFSVEYLFGRDPSGCHHQYVNILPKKIVDIDPFLSPFFFKLHVKEKKYDIIHSHAQIAYNATIWFPDINITTLHGTDHGVYEQYIFEIENKKIAPSINTKLHFKVTLFKERYAHKKAKSLISVSNGVGSEVNHYFGRQSYIAYNGVDCDEYNPDMRSENLKRKLGIPKDQLMLLFIGQTDWRKGLHYLISSFHHCKKYKLVIGGLPEKYRNKNIISLGILDDKTKKDLLASCDVFCLPSLYEGMSLIMLEAMACGKPCILTDVNGTEIISNDENGIIVKKRDVQGITKALDYLTEDSLREKIGFNARKTAEKFPWSDTVNQTINAYEKSKLI